MKKQKKIPSPYKMRNHHAYHPIMAKGGVHQSTRKSQRKKAKQALKRELLNS
jgi:hypothetical protein